MKIKIIFLGGSDYWRKKIQNAAMQVEAILSDADFLNAKVAAHPKFDFTKDSPVLVASKIMNTEVVTVRVGFYCKWLTKAIAYESGGAIYFNTRKESAGAGSWGNVMHEVLHALGYSHNGNSAAGNGNSVPYKVPDLAEAWLKEKRGV